MAPSDLTLRSQRVVTPEGVRPATLHIRQGQIDHVTQDVSSPALDCGDLVVMPGLVDTHVHVNEPGRTEWEGFETASRAAAAGGITTLVDMPLNSIPATTTRAALRAKIEAANGKAYVDVGFWGGVVPGNAGELKGLVEDGVLGFKAFLVPSGVDEFEHVGEADLREAMPELARHGAALLVHAELPGPIQAAANVWEGGDPNEYGRYLRSRPDAAEVEAVEMLVRLCRETGCRVHIVHVSSAEVLPLLKRARREQLPITAETCPHYLTFAAEEIPDGALAFKCAPPIRSRENRERLWEALREGLLDLVATDHSPSPPELKAGDFRGAWGGIASLQLSLPALWTGAQGTRLYRRGSGGVDVRRSGPSGGAGRQQRQDRSGIRCRSGDLGSGGELHGGPWKAAPPAQADPLRGADALRLGPAHPAARGNGLR